MAARRLPLGPKAIEAIARATTVQIMVSGSEASNEAVLDTLSAPKQFSEAGSGFVVQVVPTPDAQGPKRIVVMTNNHVVAPNPECTIYFRGLWPGDQPRVFRGTTMHTAPGPDLATVVIDDAEDVDFLVAHGVKAVVFGNGMQLQVGDTVHNAGHGLGRTTFGMHPDLHISGFQLMQHLNAGPPTGQAHVAFGALDTNPGNSGGPFFNAYGELIAICNAGMPGANNVCDCITTPSARRFFPAFLEYNVDPEKAVVNNPTFPITFEPSGMYRGWRIAHGIPEDGPGLLVQSVAVDGDLSPVDMAKQMPQPGDILVAISLPNFLQLPGDINHTQPLDPHDARRVTLTYYFDDKGDVIAHPENLPEGWARDIESLYQLWDYLPLGWPITFHVSRLCPRSIPSELQHLVSTIVGEHLASAQAQAHSASAAATANPALTHNQVSTLLRRYVQQHQDSDPQAKALGLVLSNPYTRQTVALEPYTYAFLGPSSRRLPWYNLNYHPDAVATTMRWGMYFQNITLNLQMQLCPGDAIAGRAVRASDGSPGVALIGVDLTNRATMDTGLTRHAQSVFASGGKHYSIARLMSVAGTPIRSVEQLETVMDEISEGLKDKPEAAVPLVFLGMQEPVFVCVQQASLHDVTTMRHDHLSLRNPPPVYRAYQRHCDTHGLDKAHVFDAEHRIPEPLKVPMPSTRAQCAGAPNRYHVFMRNQGFTFAGDLDDRDNVHAPGFRSLQAAIHPSRQVCVRAFAHEAEHGDVWTAPHVDRLLAFAQRENVLNGLSLETAELDEDAGSTHVALRNHLLHCLTQPGAPTVAEVFGKKGDGTGSESKGDDAETDPSSEDRRVSLFDPRQASDSPRVTKLRERLRAMFGRIAPALHQRILEQFHGKAQNWESLIRLRPHAAMRLAATTARVPLVSALMPLALRTGPTGIDTFAMCTRWLLELALMADQQGLAQSVLHWWNKVLLLAELDARAVDAARRRRQSAARVARYRGGDIEDEDEPARVDPGPLPLATVNAPAGFSLMHGTTDRGTAAWHRNLSEGDLFNTVPLAALHSTPSMFQWLMGWNADVAPMRAEDMQDEFQGLHDLHLESVVGSKPEDLRFARLRGSRAPRLWDAYSEVLLCAMVASTNPRAKAIFEMLLRYTQDTVLSDYGMLFDEDVHPRDAERVRELLMSPITKRRHRAKLSMDAARKRLRFGPDGDNGDNGANTDTNRATASTPPTSPGTATASGTDDSANDNVVRPAPGSMGGIPMWGHTLVTWVDAQVVLAEMGAWETLDTIHTAHARMCALAHRPTSLGDITTTIAIDVDNPYHVSGSGIDDALVGWGVNSLLPYMDMSLEQTTTDSVILARIAECSSRTDTDAIRECVAVVDQLASADMLHYATARAALLLATLQGYDILHEDMSIVSGLLDPAHTMYGPQSFLSAGLPTVEGWSPYFPDTFQPWVWGGMEYTSIGADGEVGCNPPLHDVTMEDAEIVTNGLQLRGTAACGVGLADAMEQLYRHDEGIPLDKADLFPLAAALDHTLGNPEFEQSSRIRRLRPHRRQTVTKTNVITIVTAADRAARNNCIFSFAAFLLTYGREVDLFWPVMHMFKLAIVSHNEKLVYDLLQWRNTCPTDRRLPHHDSVWLVDQFALQEGPGLFIAPWVSSLAALHGTTRIATMVAQASEVTKQAERFGLADNYIPRAMLLAPLMMKTEAQLRDYGLRARAFRRYYPTRLDADSRSRGLAHTPMGVSTPSVALDTDDLSIRSKLIKYRELVRKYQVVVGCALAAVQRDWANDRFAAWYAHSPKDETTRAQLRTITNYGIEIATLRNNGPRAHVMAKCKHANGLDITVRAANRAVLLGHEDVVNAICSVPNVLTVKPPHYFKDRLARVKGVRSADMLPNEFVAKKQRDHTEFVAARTASFLRRAVSRVVGNRVFASLHRSELPSLDSATETAKMRRREMKDETIKNLGGRLLTPSQEDTLDVNMCLTFVSEDVDTATRIDQVNPLTRAGRQVLRERGVDVGALFIAMGGMPYPDANSAAAAAQEAAQRATNPARVIPSTLLAKPKDLSVQEAEERSAMVARAAANMWSGLDSTEAIREARHTIGGGLAEVEPVDVETVAKTNMPLGTPIASRTRSRTRGRSESVEGGAEAVSAAAAAGGSAAVGGPRPADRDVPTARDLRAARRAAARDRDDSTAGAEESKDYTVVTTGLGAEQAALRATQAYAQLVSDTSSVKTNKQNIALLPPVVASTPAIRQSVLGARFLPVFKSAALAFVLDDAHERSTGSPHGAHRFALVVNPPKGGRAAGWPQLSSKLPNWGARTAPAHWRGYAHQAWSPAGNVAEACSCGTDEERCECRCGVSYRQPLLHQGPPKDAKHLLVHPSVAADVVAHHSTRWSQTLVPTGWNKSAPVRPTTQADLLFSCSTTGRGDCDDDSGTHQLCDQIDDAHVYMTPAASKTMALSAHMHDVDKTGRLLSVCTRSATGSGRAVCIAFARATQSSVNQALQAIATFQAAEGSTERMEALGMQTCPGSPKHVDVRLQALRDRAGCMLWSIATDGCGDRSVHTFPCDPRSALVLQSGKGAWLVRLHESDPSKSTIRPLDLGEHTPLCSATRTAQTLGRVSLHDFCATVALDTPGTFAFVSIRDAAGLGADHASCTVRTFDTAPGIGTPVALAAHPLERTSVFGLQSPARATPVMAVVRS